MNNKFKIIAQDYYVKAEKLLCDWIKIDSVFDEHSVTKMAPFGQGVHQALQSIGKIAEQDGFIVDYCDGYATEISFGQGPIIGIYAHADVVPVSGTWTYPPFGGILAHGKIYGRGASDDKGPAIASYMAMKLLRDQQLIKGYKVRLVIGGNEERGSSCLHYYFHHLKKPHAVAGFTPDGEFPLIYGEKGISNYKIAGPLNFKPIIKINAGVVANSVIDKAEALIRRDEKIDAFLKSTSYKYELHHDGDVSIVTFFGKAAHGSVPEYGVNAGIQLLEALGRYYQIGPLMTFAHQYSDPFGRNLNQYHESPLLHHTTFNVGLINYENGILSIVVNFRFPETIDINETLDAINQTSIAPVTMLMYSRPLLFNPKSAMVQTLLRAYQEESGDLTTPMMTIGGGTYAKEAENTVAFGSNFPGKDDHIHDVNEKIDVEDLHLSIGIYARAIHDLGQLHAFKK